MKKVILTLFIVPFLSSCFQTKTIVRQKAVASQNYWQQHVDYTMDIEVDVRKIAIKEHKNWCIQTTRQTT